jgi:hypothetical protein
MWQFAPVVEKKTSHSTNLGAVFRNVLQPLSADSAEAVLRRFGVRYQVQRDADRVAFLIQNRRGLSAEEHPFVGDLPVALEEAGVETIAFRTP